jgi:calcineurin-like phosphoesterase family protein
MLNIVLEKGQRLWFTSDTHYNHKNICRGVSEWKDAKDHTRDFNTLEKMNHAIVTQINSNVGQNDVLLHFGDWSFGGFEYVEEFRRRIVCENVHLILGNHDHHIERDRGGVRSLFKSVHQYTTLTVKDTINNLEFSAVCMHYPIASWNHMNKGMYHLHGHVHLPPSKKLHEGRAMDVGMDGNPGFRPYGLSEVVKLLKDRPIRKLTLPQDHHE